MSLNSQRREISNADFIKRYRKTALAAKRGWHSWKLEEENARTALPEALDRLADAEAECDRLRGEVSELKRKLAIDGRPEHGGILRPGDNPPRILDDD